MNKYEISLWEDFPRTITVNGEEKSYLDEKKLCVIGSSSMTSMVRAVEPKLVNNVNGTNTFTFKMYYTYIDEITGESYPNPFISMLINERKVKVLWKDEWYDLLIKNIEENTNDKSVTYTCKDSYITELSRNGYNLEFTSELQNNNGTAENLTSRVLEGSGWKFDKSGSKKIYQTSEEPVYEVSFPNSIQATLDIPDIPLNHTNRITIPAGRKVLVYKASLDPAVANGGTQISNADIQILYADGGYATEENEMVVLNGEQYKIQGNIQYSNPYIYLTVGSSAVRIKYSELSTDYRGKRYVNSPRLEYDEVFGRYVNVYNYGNTEVYGFSKTEFSDPLTIINLFANSSRFSNTSGWIGEDLSWGVYPKYDGTQELDTYRAKGYLRLKENVEYTNSGIQANSSYLMPSQGDLKRGITGGFHEGEIYIFRIKALRNLIEDGKDTPQLGSYINSSSTFSFNVKNNNTNYFQVSGGVKTGDWLEYTCTCIRACPATEIENLELTLSSTATCWIEEVQFFKQAFGIPSYDEITRSRINPGEISLQGIATTVYRFYNKDHDNATSPEEVPFIYIGDSPSGFSLATSYEKIATIEEKESNRFNILQAIAESFECWVRFKINHDDQGKVIIGSDGEPEKYVTLVDQVGEDLGWSFDYGIDLKAIKRKIISDEISTKVIVVPNQNEFAKNGFCTIARSSLNYSREIFILNFDYYINQGLLNRDQLYLDLYGTSNDDLGYFYHLSQWNAEYDNNAEKLAQKKSELLKQESELLVSQSYFQATKERITSEQSDVMFLAGVNSFSEVEDYVDSHQDNIKVLKLMNDIGRLRDTADMLDDKTGKIKKLNSSIDILKKYIYGDPDDPNKPGLQARQNELQILISNIHKRFFKKYARYIQEGTWIDEDYVDDDKYYLDALEVAYTSSRPQIQYDINVIRLNYLEDFSSKIFHVGDICYIKDQDFFNYITTDGLPYRLKILISEITTYFDSPEKDTIKVQNYKTQFDDLFERIAAATQSLQFSTGKYSKAAGLVNPDKTINFGLLQETFDYNKSIVLNAANQTVVWDSTGITVTDSANAAQMLRLMSGGLFITNDGGLTWKNAVRGDGISADILTAGRINVGEIYLYNEDFPSFRWDSDGLTAYSFSYNQSSRKNEVNFNKFVRHDQYGFYGYEYIGNSIQDFVPEKESDIWTNEYTTFGLTWSGFFMKAKGSYSVIINSNDTKGDVIKCTNGTDTTFALNKNGNATFKGSIYATTLTLGDSARKTIAEIAQGSSSGQGYLTQADLSNYLTTYNYLQNDDNKPYIQVNQQINGSNVTFVLDANGVLTAKNLVVEGTVFATNGSFAGAVQASKGKIGDWNINPQSTVTINGNTYTNNENYPVGSLYYGTSSSIGRDGTIALIPTGATASTPIGGSLSKTDWRLIVGSNFGVDTNGNLYATSGNFSGNITGSAISGSSLSLSTYYQLSTSTSDKCELNISSATLKVYPDGWGISGMSALPMIEFGFIPGQTTSEITYGAGLRAYYGSGKTDFNEIVTTNAGARMTTHGNISIYLQPGSGSVVVAGNINQSSDIRLKDAIREINNQDSLNFISSLTPISFVYKNNGAKGFGYSAQEVLQKFQSYFENFEEVNLISKDDNNYYTLNYIGLIPIMGAAITQLKTELSELKKQLNEKE